MNRILVNLTKYPSRIKFYISHFIDVFNVFFVHTEYCISNLIATFVSSCKAISIDVSNSIMMIGINLVYILMGIDVTNTRVVANYDVSMYLISSDIAIVKSIFNFIGNVVLNSIESVVSNMVSIFEYPIKCIAVDLAITQLYAEMSFNWMTYIIGVSVENSIIKANYSAQLAMYDYIGRDGIAYMELHYPVNLFNEDYDISTLKMMFTRNRTLGEYTFQIGDSNLTIYDWVYIDV